jgi:tripartite-type tricarboxylate transporter receptor subunit TctC
VIVRGARSRPPVRPGISAALLLATVVLLVCSVAIAQGQAFPQKAIRIIVPSAPAGANDTLARTLSAELAVRLRQPVIVENRPGGSGAIGLASVANAPPDGYTIGIGATGAISINPHLPNPFPLDPARQLAPVARLTEQAMFMVATRSSGVTSIQQLVAVAKAAPKGVNVATSGRYTPHHVAVELLARNTGARFNHVPYKGSGPVVADLMGGHVDFAIVDLPSSRQQILDGTFVALGVTSAKRYDLAPEVPTFREGGVPNFEIVGWNGMFAPAGTPAAVVEQLAAELKHALEQPEVRNRLRAQSSVPAFVEPSEFAKFLAADSEKWKQVLATMQVDKP